MRTSILPHGHITITAPGAFSLSLSLSMAPYLVQVVDHCSLVCDKSCNVHTNLQVGVRTVAQSKIVGGREDVNAMREVVMALPPHILLKSGRSWEHDDVDTEAGEQEMDSGGTNSEAPPHYK